MTTKMTLFCVIFLFLLSETWGQFNWGGYENTNDINELIKQEPTYFVLASKIVRPGQVYRVSVTIYRSLYPMTVRASIQRNGVELASAAQDCKLKIPETLLLKVPPTSVPGIYKLRVEGSVNGVLGGATFLNETYLEFSQRSMTIFIQTDKPIYMQGQHVRFRAVPVTTELKAFSDAVDVYMLDPNRTVMRRWLSRQTNLGAVSLEYGLSELPVFGNWSIQVVAQGQVEEKMFIVEEYYQTRFEVNVTMPSFFMETNEDIYGSVMANYTSGVPVIGNLTLIAKVESLTNTGRRRYDQTPVIEQTLRLFEGYTEFRFSMRELQRYISRLDRTRVTVTAYVGERYLDMIESGFAQAIIFNSSVKLEFLGSSPQAFKAAMPFKAYIAASYYDGTPLPKWRLNSQRLEIRPAVTYSNGRTRTLEMRREQMTPTEAGIWEMDIDLRSELGKKELVNDVRSLTIQAFYNDDSGERAVAEMLVYASYAPFDRRIQVSTSTKAPRVGEYIIFHVRSDYYVDKFVYVIISKGIILFVGTEEMTSSIKTFAVSLSPEMAPSSCILVYHVAREGEVVVDSLTFPVDGISRNNFTVALNNRKDKSSDTIEVIINGRPGTYIGLSAVDKSLYEMRSGTELTHAEVLQKMNTFDEYTNGTLTYVWHSREGHADRVVYYPSSTYGLDANRTFDFAGLVVFTDANVTKRYENCNVTDGYVPCMGGECYKLTKRCDGFKDCRDGSDESSCPKRDEIDMVKFRMYRINRILRLYESTWLWKDINIGPLGHYIFTVAVPDLPTYWMVSAFGMNAIEGFGLVPDSVPFSSVRPFYMNVEMPQKVKQGEQIGIRVSVFNYMSFEIEVTVILASSDSYKFVQVESFGIVTAYGARTSGGEHQHLIWVKPGDTAVVYMPIVPTRLGAINVTLMAKTQVAMDIVTKTIHVSSDGITQYRHTSMVLDLSQGAYLIKYMDTNVTDTPIIPFHQDRRYVFGSNKATVTVSGDVIGPTFPTMPVNASSLLHKPYACGEPTMFNFAANLHMLRYLRLTGQRRVETEKLAFYNLNIGYQHQLRYQNPDGSFSAFRWFDTPNVWLTAFCARIFHKAAFQEWENFLYIDPRVVNRAVHWLLDHQTREGSFYETSLHPLDRKMNLTSERIRDSVRYRNISLTAYVLITLAECNDLSGELGSRSATARKSAQRYLERQLPVAKEFNDPYELAIVAYALSVSHSIEGEEAFNFLDSRMKETSGMRYWSRVQLPPPTTTIENNRPYLIARLPNVDDASNVEATAYGLLVHVNRQAVIQKEIVEWLNTQRLTDGGWASTQDTIVAMEALIEYSIQSRLRDVTDVSITVEAPATPGFTKNFHIGEDNLSIKQSLEIPNAWGVVVINAQGSGLALVQLSVEYNVDWLHLMTPPPVPAFDLRVRASFYGRNSSQIYYNICQKWIRTQESDSSGMAVLEVDVPSGYIVQQQELDAYVNSNKVRNLREARFQERKTTFFFDYLDTTPICVNFKVQRWFPVANLTRYIAVKVYDYYAPERFNETMFEVYNLYVLSICHVCGSYQCPYCPAFSWASKLTSLSPLVLSACVVIVTIFGGFRRNYVS